MVSMLTLKRTAVAVLLAASLGTANALILLGGSAAGPHKHVTVHLKGGNEVPPVKTRATGEGAFDVYDNRTITGEITTHGIDGKMAHIHMGAPGTNGPVIIPLTSGPHHTWVVPQGSTLNQSQYQAFLAGDLYVNVHSAAHPGGEIRAQLRP